LKIEELCSKLSLNVLVPLEDYSEEINTAITGDLLSFIMGHALPGSVWLTVQNHLNVAAVAVLKEMPMIVLTAGRQPSTDLVDRCREEGICLSTTPESTFAVISQMTKLGLKG